MSPTIAVFPGTGAVPDAFHQGFARIGLRTVAAPPVALESREDVVAFLRRHDARAVVYELPPPGEQGWTQFQRLYGAAQAHGSPLVLSTATAPDAPSAVDGPGTPDAHVEDTIHLVCRLLGTATDTTR